MTALVHGCVVSGKTGHLVMKQCGEVGSSTLPLHNSPSNSWATANTSIEEENKRKKALPPVCPPCK